LISSITLRQCGYDLARHAVTRGLLGVGLQGARVMVLIGSNRDRVRWPLHLASSFDESLCLGHLPPNERLFLLFARSGHGCVSA
jgi:hypothetical protein